jgi:transcription factor E
MIVGKPAEDISDLLYSNKHVNEFLLSKKMNLTINQTRNLLYKLSDNGIVSSMRKKDKRKGWYTYFWRMDPAKALEFLKNSLVKKIEQLTNQIKSKETKDFYICGLCNVELNEETALINSFTCNECGGLFVLKDNLKTIKDLQKILEKLKEELKLVDFELEKERGKIEKSKTREEKKQKVIKDALRKKKRKDSKDSRDLLKKNLEKETKRQERAAKKIRKAKKMPVKKKKEIKKNAVKKLRPRLVKVRKIVKKIKKNAVKKLRPRLVKVKKR